MNATNWRQLLLKLYALSAAITPTAAAVAAVAAVKQYPLCVATRMKFTARNLYQSVNESSEKCEASSKSTDVTGILDCQVLSLPLIGLSIVF